MSNLTNEDDLATRVAQPQTELQETLAAVQSHEQELAALQAEQARREAEVQGASRCERVAELRRLGQANAEVDREYCDLLTRLVEVAARLQASAQAVDRYARQHGLRLHQPLLKPFGLDKRYLAYPGFLEKALSQRRRHT